MPKARFFMRCECCRAPIEVGARYTTFHGRPWLTAHVVTYQQQRRNIAASAAPEN